MKKLSLNDACMIAEERDGMCLSTEYKDNRTPLMWRCSKNHVWSAPLSRIKNLGQWCPQCAGNMKLTLEVTKQIALLRGGECLSKRYVNQRLPLLWRCIKGHIWNASLKMLSKSRLAEMVNVFQLH